MGPFASRCMVVIFLASSALPLSDMLLRKAVSVRTLVTDQSMRGPFHGKLVDGTWQAGDPASVFRPGDVVVWEAQAKLQPGATVSAEFVLTCRDRPIWFNHFTLVSGQVRPPGWMAYFIAIPKDAPPGRCQIQRHVTYVSEDGSVTQPMRYPPIEITIGEPQEDRR